MHTTTNCTATILCDNCGSEDHVTKACSPYKNLKFTAIPSGYAVEGLGFYNILYSGAHKGDKGEKTGTLAEIKIVEGVISTSNVEAELKRLVPREWDWNVVDNGNVFTAKFPSRVEWGPLVAKSAKATLSIDEKTIGDYFRFEIPNV